MYDPKFEKAIQQKMEELEFRPPESVWVNIEKAVVDKRRRRAGFLWRYLLPAVLVVAAAGLFWYYAGEKATRPVVRSGAGGSPVAGSTAQAGSTVQAGSPEAVGSMAAAGHSPADQPTTGAAILRSGGRMSIAGNQRARGHGLAGTSVTRGTSPAAQPATVHGSTAAGQMGTDGVEGADGVARGVGVAGGAGAEGTAEIAGGLPAAGMGGRPQAAGQSGLDAWFYLPGLADQRLSPQVQASALNTKKSNTVAMAGLSHPQRHWEAGFVAGGGLSRLNGLNSNQARVALVPSTTSFYTFSNSSSGSHYISDIRPEASFEGGIYLQRALSDRWVFNTGMNLHYYSNRITVGQQVTTYVQSSVSYLLAANVQSAANPTMYSAGDSRSVINKYYFLELPVGLQWKVNKSRLLPIFVEGDASLSRLMGASALFYDAKTGLYSRDGDIVNKTQVTIGSAVLVGLPFHGVKIQVGPQIQYGLTALVNTDGVGDQHVLYTGIRVVIIPGRK